jgi:beta-1,4-mannosyl-glycoprotein beta-1,4-N-acetylglucosaminyltransferase
VIIDAFPYGYGLEVLLIRLAELADVVDRHIIVEADRTYAGKPREIAWPTLAETPEFAPYASKVILHVVHVEPRDPWEQEEHLRDVVLDTALGFARPGDRILFGDHDEIPHPDAIVEAHERGVYRARLRTRYHEWHLNRRAVFKGPGSPHLWEFRQPLLLPHDEGRVGSLVRAAQGPSLDVGPYGWHLTLQGGPDAVYDKLQATAHTELQSITFGEVNRRFRLGLDLLDRCALEDVPDDELPRFVRDNLTHYRRKGLAL